MAARVEAWSCRGACTDARSLPLGCASTAAVDCCIRASLADIGRLPLPPRTDRSTAWVPPLVSTLETLAHPVRESGGWCRTCSGRRRASSSVYAVYDRAVLGLECNGHN